MGKLIAKTATLTFAALLAVCLISFGVFSIFFPSVMVDVTNGLGMERACATYSLSVFERSNKTSDLATAVERCYNVGRYDTVAEYGEKLLGREDYYSYCKERDQKTESQGYAGGNFQQYTTGIVACAQYEIGQKDLALETALGAVGDPFPENSSVAYLAFLAVEKDDIEYCGNILSALQYLDDQSEALRDLREILLQVCSE